MERKRTDEQCSHCHISRAKTHVNQPESRSAFRSKLRAPAFCSFFFFFFLEGGRGGGGLFLFLFHLKFCSCLFPFD